MKSLKGSIALICTIGIYAMGAAAYAAPDSSKNINSAKSQNRHSDSQNIQLTYSPPLFFDRVASKKDVGPEAMLLRNPTKENAGKYITLTEQPADTKSAKSQKKISIKQSFSVRPSPIFNIGTVGLLPVPVSGFSGYGATVAGNSITFSYANNNLLQDPGALNVSIGSQFLIEPSRVIPPLYNSSEYDRANNRQVYNLSVGMGYAGFRLGASFSRERTLYAPGLKGYDFGLGYSGDKWGANIRFGEYKRERDRLFETTREFYNDISALEVGAAYQIFSNIRFTGRFTYYSYGHKNARDKIRNSQVFFLGTNVNF